MASNGLLNRAKNGKCRICRRSRCTEKYVKAVGEVHHGYATGHIWECIDADECEKVAIKRAASHRPDSRLIQIALERGRLKEYIIIT
jgi:hypothetical protein